MEKRKNHNDNMSVCVDRCMYVCVDSRSGLGGCLFFLKSDKLQRTALRCGCGVAIPVLE